VDLARNLAALDPAVRRLDESELVDVREARERTDQADVGALRRLDRAHPPVVRGVDIPDLQPGALTREPTRSERREAPTVGQAGQGGRLGHELRQLRRPEELLDR